MITKQGLRSLLESDGVGGDPRKFGQKLTHLMGLTDARGKYHTDRHGNRKLVDPAGQPRLRIDEIPVRALMETLLGDDAEGVVRQVRAYGQMRPLLEQANGDWTRSLIEDNAAGAVMASQFANINAFTAGVTGLLDVAILEAYENPLFIGDNLAPVEPSKIFEGRKTIGVSRLGNVAEERLPGMPTKRVQVGERWMTQPRTIEKSMACEVTQEALFLDITGGQLAEHAGAPGVGEWLGYAKELDIIDSFIGVTASYNYKGTSYNTYIAGGYYDNYIASGSELLHDSDIEDVLIKFRDMTDPDTNTRILINPNTLLVNRRKMRTAYALVGPAASGYQLRDNETAGAGVKNEIRMSDPAYKGQFTILESPLVYERARAADGLNLNADSADNIWITFESGLKTHVWVQNWPLRTQSAAPNQVDMIDRGVVMYTKADLRGVAMWKDPRRAVQARKTSTSN